MAQRDTPTGYRYDPKTRGAVNLTTGESISRRQVEKLRIAQETGTTGSFEAKRKQRQEATADLFRFPRRLERKHAVYGYRVHDWQRMIDTIDHLPPRAEVWVKVYGRSNLANPNDESPGFWSKRRHRWSGFYVKQLRWVSLSEFFQAQYLETVLPFMTRRMRDYTDIRAIDIIVRRILPEHPTA